MLTTAKKLVKRIPWIGPTMQQALATVRRRVAAPAYTQWIRQRIEERSELYPAPTSGTGPSQPPQFDILTLTYNTDPVVLRKTAESLFSQDYPHWRWVIWDNASSRSDTLDALKKLESHPQVVIHRGTSNSGITEGHRLALEKCDREYVVLVDHDDLLYRDALRIIAWHVIEHDRPGFLYSDEDKCDMEDRRFHPSFKPDVSPSLILDTAYTCHVSVAKRELLIRAGAFTDPVVEGTQDWDMTLRLFETGCQIVHIPEVIYTWRGTPESAAIRGIAAKPYVIEAQKMALTRALERRGLKQRFHVEANPLFPLPTGHWRATRLRESTGPLIDVVLILEDPKENWRDTVAGILHNTDYPNYRLRVIETAGCAAATSELAYLTRGANVSPLPPHVSVEQDVPGPFNRAATLNRVLHESPTGQPSAEYIACIPSGARLIARDWLWEAVGCFELNSAASAVAGRLFDVNHQAIGGAAVFGAQGAVEVAYIGASRGTPGYFACNFNHRNVSAFLFCPWVARRVDALAIGGFDTRFPLAFLEADFAARCHKSGRQIVSTPYIAAYGSRPIGFADSAAEELSALYDSHVELIRNDPFYSPFLSMCAGTIYEQASPVERANYLNSRLQHRRVNTGDVLRFQDLPIEAYEVRSRHSFKRAA